jgi:hypothetical protein
MTGWTRVNWTQARQVAQLMDPHQENLPAENVTPEAHFTSLCARGELEAAAGFLGQALPRFEAIEWAQRALAIFPPAPRTESTRKAIGDWIKDPDDRGRRAAWDAAQDAPDDSPERLLSAALFLSGGSIAPPDLPTVNPQPELSGRLAAAAVVTAAHRSGDAAGALRRALGDGENIARGNR